MRILIKGAKMPASCEECQSVLGLFDKECPLFKDFPKKFICESELLKHARYSKCPLVEIPPYGRLIDADETKRVFGDYFEKVKVARRYAESLVDNAIPTVIESEEQEHEY